MLTISNFVAGIYIVNLVRIKKLYTRDPVSNDAGSEVKCIVRISRTNKTYEEQ